MTMTLEDLTPEDVEGVAARQLVTLTQQFAELQRHTQPDDGQWFMDCVAGCAEISVTVTLTRGGIASVRLAAIAGDGTEEPLRVVELKSSSPN